MKYPNLETYRRDSDPFDFIPELHGPSYLENYSQLFVKAPAMTKDLLEKMNADIVPKKTYMFGYELSTKKILLISGLFLLFTTSFFGMIVMWFTDSFDNAVFSKMVISNTSEDFSVWEKPSAKLLHYVYPFNYTNVKEYMARTERKLHVQELGPYVYEEAVERVNVVFNDDDTVSFQEKRTYNFRPDLSKGRQNERVNVPNVPLLTGAAMSKYRNFFARLAFASVLSGLDATPFLNVAVDGYIHGYDDNLFDLSKTLGRLEGITLPEKFGLLSGRSGLQPTVITMNTGKKDVNRLGVIEKLNGQEQFDHWSTDACNRIKSSDGVVYPPKFVQNKEPLQFLIPQMCRTIPLQFEEEVTIFDGQIPAYKYVVPEDIFDSADEKPENQCYCSMTSGDCPLKGTFNATSCSFGAPIFVSLPHFHRADKSLLEGISGLNTARKDYQSFANLHPILGFAMTGTTRLQMNIQVQKPFGVYQLDNFEDGLMLPLAWFETMQYEDNLPQEFVDIIYDTTYTLKGVKMALKYGCSLTALMTLVCIVLVLKYRWHATRSVAPVGSRAPPEGQQENGVVEEI